MNTTTPAFKCTITLEDTKVNEECTHIRIMMQFDPPPSGAQLLEAQTPTLALATLLKKVIDAWHNHSQATNKTYTEITRDDPEEGTRTE